MKKIILLTLICASVSLWFAGSPASAQDTTNAVSSALSDPASSPAVATATTILGPLLSGLAGRYGWIVQILVVIAAVRFFVKPIMTLVDSYVKSNCTPEEYARLDHFEHGPIFKWISFSLDWLGSIKLPVLRAAVTGEVPAPKEKS